jgi:hypothetical protein
MPNVSRADRLNAVLAKTSPKQLAHFSDNDGVWLNRHPNPGTKRDTDDKPVLKDGKPQDARHSGAPYLIDERDGRVRISVVSDDGDMLAGIGVTLDEAIDSLERKVGIGEREAK